MALAHLIPPWPTKINISNCVTGQMWPHLDEMEESGDQRYHQHLVIRRSLVRFHWSACRRILGRDIEPQTAPDVLGGTLHGSHRHQRTNVWITVSRFGQKHLLLGMLYCLFYSKWDQIYKMNITLCWRRVETSGWEHKLRLRSFSHKLTYSWIHLETSGVSTIPSRGTFSSMFYTVSEILFCNVGEPPS